MVISGLLSFVHAQMSVVQAFEDQDISGSTSSNASSHVTFPVEKGLEWNRTVQ